MEGILIKEAAKMLEVESHVLRYWEEELGIDIKRNSMGHRYYDERDIKLFKDVKELKKRGLTLKDIKSGIDNKKKYEKLSNGDEGNEIVHIDEPATLADDKVVDFKLAQIQSSMNRIVANALRENKDIITTSIKAEVTADVMRQFDTVMREKEEKEEARFKKLDETLRKLQQVNEEVAATKIKKKFKWRK